jgi:phosphate transport system substrate-binding protein
LLAFDGLNYRLKTSVGELSLDANGLICEGKACPDETPPLDVAVSGAPGIVDKMLPPALAAFAAVNGTDPAVSNANDALRYTADFGGQQANLDITSGTSAAAFADLLEGRATVAFTNRAATDAERAQFAAAGIPALREQTLAIDGFTIVTSKDDALPTISIENIARIFSGDLQNWSQIGGPDAAITLYAREAGSRILDERGASGHQPRCATAERGDGCGRTQIGPDHGFHGFAGQSGARSGAFRAPRATVARCNSRAGSGTGWQSILHANGFW